MNPAFRVSGHESFPCRYSWLPKAVRRLGGSPRLFAKEEEETAMVQLGLGKNMVKSLRFWVQATDVARPNGRGEYRVTALGSAILGDGGFDEFLEDTSTLWLLHWNLSTNLEAPLFAWDFLLSRWQEPNFTFGRAADALEEQAKHTEMAVSRGTIEQHLETFLHTYTPTRGRKGLVQEDNLDCPLVELELIVPVKAAENEKAHGRSEPVYAFRREDKIDIRPELFVYCLNDFWQKRFPDEKTLPLKEIAHGHCSPGQVFKIPEEDIRARVEQLERETNGIFAYTESTTQQQVRRNSGRDSEAMLASVYQC